MTKTKKERLAHGKSSEVAFDPSDYEVIAYTDRAVPTPAEFTWMDPVGGFHFDRENFEFQRARYHAQSQEWFGQDFMPATCQHCGKTGLRWIAVVHHRPSDTNVVFGEICADEADLPGRSALAAKRARQAAERAAEKAGIEAARKGFAEAAADVSGFLDTVSTNVYGQPTDRFDFINAMWSARERFGYLTERQVAATRAVMARRAEQAERRQEEATTAGPAPDGVAEVTGVIVSERTEQGDWGWQTKMLVRLANGARVWLTKPAALDEATKGDTITFTATFTAKAEDPSFAFGSRPRKATVVTKGDAA